MPFYKGYKHPPESRLKMRLAKLGRPMPEETKTKIGLSNRGKVISLEQREKISMAHKGVKLSDAHVQSICIAQRKRWASGEVCWAQGKTFSEQHKKRLSIAHIGKHSRKKIFKGTRSQYTALHVWVKNRLSKVQCEHCFTSERLQYANKSGLYEKHIEDWLVLCNSCHVKYDESFTEEEIEKGRVCL